MSAIACLGRFGDVINCLPVAWEMARRGGRTRFLISKDFASLLDGCSYVQPVIYPGDYSTLPVALQWAGRNGLHSPRIAQAYNHPFDKRRLTESYNRESWRIAGFLPMWNSFPLVFDRRNLQREADLLSRLGLDGRQLVLVSVASNSSFFKEGPQLLVELNRALPDCQVLDVSGLRAERVYDLLGLFDAASLIVAVDTMHLHLARASSCPVLALVNEGWLGSTCPPQTLRTIRYSAARSNMEAVAWAARGIIDCYARLGCTALVVDMFGDEPRHLAARATWKPDIGIYRNEWSRDAQAIGNELPLPYLRDLLRFALKESTSDADCIVWTNDDVALAPLALETLKAHTDVWDFCTVRRSGESYVHVGRELMAFRSGWLRQNINRLPDSILGAPDFDLHWAAWLRKERGIITNGRNLVMDFFPAELPPGLAMHEPHDSAWSTHERIASPATRHNRRLFREWARTELPHLRFSSDNIVMTK